MKKLFFRVDGNSKIGLGHIMRCLSIANTARLNRYECVFITSDNSVSDLIYEQGFENIVLNTNFENMDEEVSELLKILLRENCSILFIDSYFVTPYYFESLYENIELIYIDDVLKFPYKVNKLINYNVYASKNKYELLYEKASFKKPNYLLGLDYVPLRKEFSLVKKKEISPVVKDILISVGGADPERMAKMIADKLVQDEKLFKTYNFHFVIGSFEPDEEWLMKLAESYKWIIIHKNVKKMAELMTKCDMAISAAGSTLYELCACGVPTITYILADNQIKGALEFEKLKIMLNVGDFRKEPKFAEKISKIMIELINDWNLRVCISEKQRALINGSGPENIISKI